LDHSPINVLKALVIRVSESDNWLTGKTRAVLLVSVTDFKKEMVV